MNYTALAFLFFMLSEWIPPIVVGGVGWLAWGYEQFKGQGSAEFMLGAYYASGRLAKWILRLLSLGCLVRAL